jgi:hypothetical protein
LRHDRMKREHRWNPSSLRLECAAEGGGGDDAHVAVRDVDALVGERVADCANAVARAEEAEDGRERRIDAPHSDSIDQRFARRWRDDDDVMSSGDEPPGEVLEVKLDTADARMIPVADEGDLHGGGMTGA